MQEGDNFDQHTRQDQLHQISAGPVDQLAINP